MKMDEKVNLFVEALEKELTAEDIDTHLEGCIGCGNCGHACAWYLVTNDPKRHPKVRSDIVRKIYRRYLTTEGKILGKLGLIETPTDKYIEESMSLFWDSCTLCGRCSLACMQGVSNRRITQLARTALTSAGIMPDIVKTIKKNSVEKQHSFGLSFEDYIGRVFAAVGDEGVSFSLGKAGADYLWVCSAIASTNAPHEEVVTAKLLNAMNVNYTVSKRLMETGSEAHTIVLDPSLSRHFIEEIEEEARRLQIKKGVLISECGCDLRTFLVDVSEILGREFDLEVVYIDPMLLDMIGNGTLPVEKLDMKVTLHDPCWNARLTGYIDEPRELLKRCVTDFVEMKPNREHNYCCNGGAGPWRMWPIEKPEDNLRLEVSALKAKQIEQTGANYVATPCTLCYLSLKDIVSFYNLKAKPCTVIDIVCQSVEKALEKRGELDRMKTPINMRGSEK